MKRQEICEVLARGRTTLDAFLPRKAGLLFPILYAACVWAGRRVFNYRDHLLNWRIWLDPETVRSRPDRFILDFFENDETLRGVYSREIRGGDMAVLRPAFRALYPVWGLEDAFLLGLFKDDLAARDFKRISAEFVTVAGRAWDDIKAVEMNRDFWEFLEGLGIEIASLGIHLLADEAVRDILAEALDRKREVGRGLRKGE